jgi:mRNA-degrading endonuclease RelE of RelBE toxin-antitoxin system
VVFGATFARDLKHLERRYPHIRADMAAALDLLLRVPETGVIIPDDYGMGKLRVRNRDARHGKSGGYRVIYYRLGTVWYCLALYAKADRSDITRYELQQLLFEIEQLEKSGSPPE